MTNRTPTTLYRTAQTAWAKYHRNASKLAWMDATRRMGDLVTAYAPQLDGYHRAALAASEAFAAAVAGLSAEAVVEIITSAEEAA